METTEDETIPMPLPQDEHAFNANSITEMKPFSVEALIKGVRKELSAEEQQELNGSLLDLPLDQAVRYLSSAYHTLDLVGAEEPKRRKSFLTTAIFKDSAVSVSASKFILDFGLNGAEAPLNKSLRDNVTLTCKKGKGKFVVVSGKPQKTHSVQISPMNGIIKKKAPIALEITLQIRTTLTLRQVIAIDVQNFGRIFLIIKLRSEKSVFGVDVAELVTVEDYGRKPIPAVLKRMREYLFEQNGIDQEGVFRLAGDELETIEVKAKLNDGSFSSCKDINCIANLIKVFFRELPQQLLNPLPSSSFLSSESEEECVAIFQTLQEPNKSLMLWLMDLMADVAKKEAINKMGPRNLAIVIAPNLFLAPHDLPPVESLMLSQKVVNFVILLLQHHIKTRS